jgi:hypothetical protein
MALPAYCYRCGLLYCVPSREKYDVEEYFRPMIVLVLLLSCIVVELTLVYADV